MILKFPITPRTIEIPVKFPVYLKSEYGNFVFKDEKSEGIAVYDHSIHKTNRLEKFQIDKNHQLSTKREFNIKFKETSKNLKLLAL